MILYDPSIIEINITNSLRVTSVICQKLSLTLDDLMVVFRFYAISIVACGRFERVLKVSACNIVSALRHEGTGPSSTL